MSLDDQRCPGCGELRDLDAAGELPVPLEHGCCACQDDGIIKGGEPCPFCTIVRPQMEVWQRMGIPPVFALSDLTTWHPQDAPQRIACELYVQHWPPDPWMLTLVGNTGTGKTHLAVGILKAAQWRHGAVGLFVKYKEMLDRFRATQGDRRTEDEGFVLDLYCDAPLLVIDELGFGRATEYADEMAYAVIDRRWAGRKPTVVTCNADALDSLDARVQSRLAHGRTVVFDLPDRRVNQ